jgi:hypothetical protein
MLSIHQKQWRRLLDFSTCISSYVTQTLPSYIPDLIICFQTGRSVFGSGARSGLEGILSAFSPSSSSAQAAERGVNAFEPSGTVAHIAVPFYSANRPNMLIVVATATPFFTFNPADVAFVSNLGVMLVAHLSQRTIVDADAAKTGTLHSSFGVHSFADGLHSAFVSKIRYVVSLLE